MKHHSLLHFPAFVGLVLIIGLACRIGAQDPTPTAFIPPTPIPQQPSPIPQQPTPVPQQPTPVPQQQVPATPSQSSSSGGWVTFTDENELYAIDLPGNWTYEHTIVDETTKYKYYYIDTFTSPDGGAVIENIVYDDWIPFTGKDKSTFALFFLNNWYSSTGREGDIRISEDSMQADGSERLVWTSRGGGYSGVSFLETRGTTTFLFLTLNWGNDYEEQYAETVDAVLSSYRIP